MLFLLQHSEEALLSCYLSKVQNDRASQDQGKANETVQGRKYVLVLLSSFQEASVTGTLKEE